MTENQLIQLVNKEYCFGSAEWWVEKVKAMPKNVWFSPSNSKDCEDFTMCNEMHYHGWAARLSEPIWNNGSYQGNKISFFIKIDQQ